MEGLDLRVAAGRPIERGVDLGQVGEFEQEEELAKPFGPKAELAAANLPRGDRPLAFK